MNEHGDIMSPWNKQNKLTLVLYSIPGPLRNKKPLTNS